MIDLEPAARRMAVLLSGIADRQLEAPTPCPAYTLGGLIEHVGGLAQAFRAAAAKELGPLTSQGPDPDTAELDDDWRTTVPRHLDALVAAWRRPEAWEGMTQAGGVDLPGEAAGVVALDELVIHGWDIARASGQPYDVDEPTLNALQGFVLQFDAQGTEGLFGPRVDVPPDAPLLDRVIGLTGRDPAWTA